jgi:hypothetical protein
MQPGCSPLPMVIHKDDHHPCGGEKQAGLRPLPRPQLQGCSSSWMRRRVHRVEGRLRVGSGPLLPSVIGGEGRSPPVALSAAASLAPRSERPWRSFRCLLLPLGRSVAARSPHGLAMSDPPCVVGCTGGSPNTSYATRAVLVFWDSPGEDGSEDLPVQFGVAAVCRCGVGGQVAAVVGAKVVVVAIGEASSADETISATWIRTPAFWLEWLVLVPRTGDGFEGLFLDGFEGLFLDGFEGLFLDGFEGLFLVVFASRQSLLLSSHPRRRSLSLLVQWSPTNCLELVIPQAFWCGGCLFLREWTQSPVCSGTILRARCNRFEY